MKTTGITPGPWVVRDETNRNRGVLEIRTVNNQKICGVPYMSGAATPRENARAIAEVPAMIEAIESLMERCEFFLKRDPDDDTKQAYVDARAILRRIEGAE